MLEKEDFEIVIFFFSEVLVNWENISEDWVFLFLDFVIFDEYVIFFLLDFESYLWFDFILCELNDCFFF